MNENTIYKKSFDFAVRIAKLYNFLCSNYKEYTISKQLLRCGTSIGSNVNEAISAQSKKDFISKMAIANKEARETKYWINLLIATDYLSKTENHVITLQNDIEEIIKILTSIVKTSQENLKKEQNVK
ncbi:four helix bundle protein [Hippea maritima]|uniref:CHP02436-containing protein n=1 Tax=Hippea maritima (strain ATCC 700847 / DSM 10411 / MH2) TaxID=760142 RepID=F2LUX7_HIPMA|nr:four helix bundle protein [Hippea maritima]AEA34646.1 CHP02436-containing protein [Hippea maritima DSM 10411]